MNLAFGSVVALDVALFIALLAMGLQAGRQDGGREMGLAFFVVLPGGVLGLAVLLYVFGTGTGWRALALGIATVPGLFVAGAQLRGLYLAHAGAPQPFGDPALQALAEAVVRRDLAALRRIGPRVDVNTARPDGTTLLAIAAQDDDFQAAWPVVQALLARGATPDRRLERVLQRKHPDFLRATHRRISRA
jgi:hypothetical protein